MGRLGFVSVLMILSLHTMLLSLDLIAHWVPLYDGIPPVLSILFGVFGLVAISGLAMVVYRSQKSGGWNLPVALHK
ncbi:hypothetical protein J2753_001498 [Halolamina salifodinae]|uniref:Uncharacterized protein n=1 Tax=Halolamina salifodinae TaxID=1202767 RepID=A0A8T4GX11_9EURY|nr:hypothetical protein [Halolamina salifodinae]